MILPRRHRKIEARGWGVGVLLSGSQRRLAAWRPDPRGRDDGVIWLSLPLESWRLAAWSYRRGRRRAWVDVWLGRNRRSASPRTQQTKENR